MAIADIYKKATLVQIPSGYKSGTLYSVVPNTADGDFTVSADADATRVNKDGLIESTSANQARLNYDFDNPQDPHLLLEPTRTNYVTNSNDASQWTEVISSGTITTNANYSTAPDGSNEATRLQASVSGSGYALLLLATTTAFTGSYSSTVYVKSNTGSNQTVSFYGRNNTTNLHTVTNEWTRIEIIGSVTSGLDAYSALGVNTAYGTQSNPIDILVWGGQLEAGAYSTSIIPTEGSAVTRTNDLISNSYTGLTSASGTIFLDLDTKGFDSSFSKIIALRDTVTGDTLRLEPFDSSGTKKFAFFGINGSSATPPSEDILPINNRKKIALTFDSGNFKYASDGVITTGTYSGTARQYNQIGGANITGGAVHNGIIHQLMIFDEVLSDAELQTLTS